MASSLKSKNNTLVIALGGSVLFPDKINVQLIIKLKRLFKKITEGRRIKLILIVGGGYPARNYQTAAKKIHPGVSQIELDEIGIAATRFNAELIKIIFGSLAAKKVVYSENLLKKPIDKITVISGWTPGCSTDTIAVRAAKKLKLKLVIIAGRPTHVYTHDFIRFKMAKPLMNILWKNYRKLIPDVWSPGMPSPVDPIAAREAQKNNIDAIVIGGKNIENLESLLLGRKFKGTLISNKNLVL
ncbi:MAG: hypothetical protein A3A97_00050 [Candidatus Terrybacteria bacterium RIFCSPLOWO2_01_FULL_40_23]|uniref:UMP kinase n=1 Tax=Candidatus Terrybacteria bacterium RIFCSPLOWO2_01_FULL_40_23 TaxID=1802366 RepID=A0A1G2PW12_9BACT|nr:MAG: hypothetical protein A3A97_00050 [Candidatus Terrybacteria bacterium RIFCSPLOWO2_01_FULL_40_23]